MKEEKVSVIVAVYKAEEFLKRCVESLLGQTYENTEIVLVDDESPDNSPKMCDDFAKHDKRVKVVHKKNGGVSSAWNAGLDNATGDYICFVDSDDWVEKTYIEDLYNAIKKYNADISICCNNKVYSDRVIYDGVCPGINSFVPAEKVLDVFFAEKRWRHTTWGKLYRREIFNNIRYPENIMCSEDSYMICDLCKQVKNGIATIDKILYNYVIRDGSVSYSVSEKRFDRMRAKRHNVEILDANGKHICFAVYELFDSYKAEYYKFKKAKRKDLIKQLDVWYKEDYKKYAKKLKRKKFRFFMFRYFRFLCDIFYFIRHKGSF